jgi:hypothetical protein
MRHLIVVLAALLIPTATMAEGPCKNDVQKFCKDATTPEGPSPRACLDQHKAELSEACKAKLEMGKEAACCAIALVETATSGEATIVSPLIDCLA